MHPAPPTDRARPPGPARSETGGTARSEGAASGPGRSERLALRHWSLPVKLAAVLLVPTLFVLALGVLQIVQQTQRASAYDGVQQAVGLQGRTTDLLTALAAERTAAAGIAGRAGPVPPDALARLQAAAASTTRTAGALVDAGRSADDLDPTGRTALDRVAGALPALDALRAGVPARRVDLAGVLARYGDVTAPVLRFSDALTRAAAVPTLAATSDALYQLSVATDVDGELRALVSGAIAAGRLDPALVPAADSALLRRGIAAGELRAAVGDEGAGIADQVSGPEQQARDRVVADAVARPGQPITVSAADWDRTAGAVQDRDGAVATQLRGRLADEASSLQGGERTGAVVVSVVLLVALLAGAVVVWFVARSLLRPLRLLRRSALDVAERRLPAAVRSLRDGETPDTTIVPTPITTREEIGQVARAFDQVHEQAVRLAAEQAGLRTAFNSIFVNLSRRSQALVERQLRLIEALENHEEDPEALSELFQLDHLATRMRRNSENLLVLAGTDLSRRNTRPVPLVDVLRSSASEVEQYQRVDLSSAAGVQILGRNADDVVHLVAELLENATTFSAPDTRVEVATTAHDDGSLTIEVSDRGVGMSEDDLSDANARLADPPTVDVSASRRMGLFVVGRLAVRHGITVTLRAREGGGLVTEAVVPPAVVLPVAQPQGPQEARTGQVVQAGPAVPAGQGVQGEGALLGSGLPVRRPGEAGARAAGAALPVARAAGGEPVTDVFAAGRSNGHDAPRAASGAGRTGAAEDADVSDGVDPAAAGPDTGASPVTGPGPTDASEPLSDDMDDVDDTDDVDDGDDSDEDDRTVSTAIDPTTDEGRTVWRRPDAATPPDDVATVDEPAVAGSAVAGSADDGTADDGTGARAGSAVASAPEDSGDADAETDTDAGRGTGPDPGDTADDTPPMGIPMAREGAVRPSPSRREPVRRPDDDRAGEAPGAGAGESAGTGTGETLGTGDTLGTVGTADDLPDRSAFGSLTDAWPLPSRSSNGSRHADPPPERTPIFEEIASAWFREGMSDSDREDAVWWSSERDEGWQAAAQAASVDDEEVTAAGLPRRRPRARLVPGGMPSSTPSGSSTPAAGSHGGAHAARSDGTATAPAPRRDPEAVRGRLASYQRGVASGRSARAAVGADPDDQEQS